MVDESSVSQESLSLRLVARLQLGRKKWREGFRLGWFEN